MHGPLRISSLSTEYVYAWVSDVVGVETVEVALIQAVEPADEDWSPAEWANVRPAGADARILVGPEGLALAKGTWHMWVRVTSMPEVPVMYSGPILVT